MPDEDDPGRYPDLDGDEATTLTQFLDLYRERALRLLRPLSDEQARTRTLPDTDLTAGGVVKHLAHMEDHWFTARIAGAALPEPWASAPGDRPDWDLRSAADDSVERIVALYGAACSRSRAVVRDRPDLDVRAPRPSFGGKGRVTLRWAMVHMLEETACHVGHLQALTDPFRART